MASTDSAPALKAVFREGWSDARRVEQWARKNSRGELEDPGCRVAWRAAIHEALGTAPAGAALDVGTGPGTIAQLLAERALRVTGLDFSPTMLAVARAQALDLTQGDAEAPPFRAGSFDVVCSRLVLFTLPRPGLAVRRWVHLLRPGGTLVLIGEDSAGTGPRRATRSEPAVGRWHPDERYRAALGQLPIVEHGPGTVRVIMEATGLKEIRAIDMSAVTDARDALRRAGPNFDVPTSRAFAWAGRTPSVTTAPEEHAS